MTKIYLIEVGEYSGTEIVAVFDEEHKEEAEKKAELLDGQVLGPFELNKLDCETPPPGLLPFHVEMKNNGKVEWVGEMSLLKDGGWQEPIGELQSVGHQLDTYANLCEIGRMGRRKSHWRLHVQCYAKDKTHAIKIANEKRVMILAGSLAEKEGASIR